MFFFKLLTPNRQSAHPIFWVMTPVTIKKSLFYTNMYFSKGFCFLNQKTSAGFAKNVFLDECGVRYLKLKFIRFLAKLK